MDWKLREDIREVIDRAFYYSDDEFMVKLDKALEGIEDLIDEQEKKNK